MTVADLIAALSKLPADALVLTDAQDINLTPIDTVGLVHVTHDPDHDPQEWFIGAYSQTPLGRGAVAAYAGTGREIETMHQLSPKKPA